MTARIIFWITLLYVVYVIVIYPVFLAWLARVRARPILRQPYTPAVSMIIATYNGASFLKHKLDSVFALDYPEHLLEVIVVSDGSTDKTKEIAESYGRGLLFIDSARMGKAAALNQGMEAARGDIFVFSDVRQRLAADSLRALMENFSDPRVGVVSAELQIEPGSSNQEADIGAYWKYERWIRVNLSAVDSIFGASGSYYAVRRELAVPVPINTLTDDMYLPLNAFFKGYRLVVDPRAKMYDYPTNLATEFGRKVRTLAGNYQILGCYPQLLSLRNRLLLHFLSYKFARLVLPFVLVTCAISSIWAGGRLAVVSGCAQGCFYVAAILDLWIPAGTMLKRITSPIRSFLVMMLATLCAISIWFVPPERLWKTTRIVTREEGPLPPVAAQ